MQSTQGKYSLIVRAEMQICVSWEMDYDAEINTSA